MTDFIVTPTNTDLLNFIFWNDFTQKWNIPILKFNTNFINPFYNQTDTINEDPKYQKHVIDHFYMRLTEKWLYKNPVFRKLLKFFRTEKNGDEIKVSLLSNIDDVKDNVPDEENKKYIFRYIEKIFISKKFVDKTLRKYVDASHVKWYDLFHNTDILKDLFAHKLKKLIIATVYDLHDLKKKEK